MTSPKPERDSGDMSSRMAVKRKSSGTSFIRRITSGSSVESFESAREAKEVRKELKEQKQRELKEQKDQKEQRAKQLKETKLASATLRREEEDRMKLNQVFRKLEVESIDGQNIGVPQFWKNGPVVLYFIRRFGCIVCRHNATILSRCKAALDAKGVRFVAVAPERDGMEDFVAGEYFKGEVYADPNRACYKALRLKRASLLGILSKRVRQVIDRATNSGIKGNMKGDFKQLGGLFVITPDGDKGHCQVLLEFRDAFFGDAVDASFMLKVLGIKAGDAGYDEATERREEDYEDANVPDSAMADKNECVVCLRSAIMEEEEAQETVAQKDDDDIDMLIKLEEEKIQTVLLSRAMEPVSLLDIREVLSRTADMTPPPVPRRRSKMMSPPLSPKEMVNVNAFEVPPDLPPPSSFLASPTTQKREPAPKPLKRMNRGVVGCGEDVCG